MDLNQLRRRLESFTQEMSKEGYLTGSGQKETVEIVQIYQNYSDIFAPEVLELIKDKKDGAEGEELRQLTYLYNASLLRLVGNKLKDVSQSLTSKQLQAKVQHKGKEVSYRMASVMVGNTDNRQDRLELEGAISAKADELNPDYQAALSATHDLVADMGFQDYVKFCEQVQGMELEALAQLMQEFLTQTDELYTQALKAQFKKDMDLSLDQATKADLAALFRAKGFDSWFAAEKLVPTLEQSMKEMGLDLDTQPNIILDVEAREKKSPRAFCSAVRAPEEVYLVIMPSGGQDDYQAILHEAGHAQHYANVDPNLPYEYRRLGDKSVTETYAFLFHYLTTDPSWISRHLEMPDPKEYTRFAWLIKLQILRRYAAKLLYEIKLHRKEIKGDEAAETYAQILTDATKVKYSPEMYLADTDSGFYSAQYLRAWIFEAQLRQRLIAEFGKGWYTNSQTGKKLRELYSLGAKYTVDELAVQMGYSGLDIGPLVKEITSGLS